MYQTMGDVIRFKKVQYFSCLQIWDIRQFSIGVGESNVFEFWNQKYTIILRIILKIEIWKMYNDTWCRVVCWNVSSGLLCWVVSRVFCGLLCWFFSRVLSRITSRVLISRNINSSIEKIHKYYTISC